MRGKDFFLRKNKNPHVIQEHGYIRDWIYKSPDFTMCPSAQHSHEEVPMTVLFTLLPAFVECLHIPQHAILLLWSIWRFGNSLITCVVASQSLSFPHDTARPRRQSHICQGNGNSSTAIKQPALESTGIISRHHEKRQNRTQRLFIWESTSMVNPMIFLISLLAFTLEPTSCQWHFGDN